MNGRRRVVITDIGPSAHSATCGDDVGEPRCRRVRRRRSCRSAKPSRQFISRLRASRRPTSSRRSRRVAWMLRADDRRRSDSAARLTGIDIAAEADRIGGSIATGIGGLKAFQVLRHAARAQPWSARSRSRRSSRTWAPAGSRYLPEDRSLSSQCTACGVEHGDWRGGGRDPASGRRTARCSPAGLRQASRASGSQVQRHAQLSRRNDA